MKIRFLSPLLLLVAIGLAGCNTQPPKPGILAADGEYEYVTPLGSNIPVRVKKGEKAMTASPTDTVSADQATNAIRSAGQPISIPGQKP